MRKIKTLSIISLIVILLIPILNVSFINSLNNKNDTIINLNTKNNSPFTIENNDQFTLYDNRTGTFGTKDNPWIIENYTINGGGDYGILIEDTTDYFILRNCIISGFSTYAGIKLDNVTNAIIYNNTCYNNMAGLELSSTNNSLLDNNSIVEAQYMGDGLKMYSSNNNLIYNNNASDNSKAADGYGIYLSSSCNNTFINNTLNDNVDGVFSVSSSNNNTFFNNTMNDNSWFGLEFSYSHKNNATNNTINNCQYGIVFSYSNYSVIRYNQISPIQDLFDFGGTGPMIGYYIENNEGPNEPILTDGSVGPSSGNITTNFIYTVNYSNPNNEAPLFVRIKIDDIEYDMNKQDSDDSIYTDGCLFNYTKNLTQDFHSYMFYTSSDIQNITLPKLGEFVGPEVLPIIELTEGSVAPETGNSETIFTFSVNYTDPFDQEPDLVTVVIDSIPHEMIKQDPSDSTYSDGCIYNYSTTLTSGIHLYHFNATNGTILVRNPDSEDLILTVINLIPSLTDGNVDPVTGDPSTIFTFKVNYTDLDNDAPNFIYVVIDNTNHIMQKLYPTDTTYSDGCIYICSIQLSVGNHIYFFNASDGNYLVNTSIKSKPTVFDNTPPPHIPGFTVLFVLIGIFSIMYLYMMKERKKFEKN